MTYEQSVFFEQFYREYFSQLVVYAYCFLKDWNSARVAAQEAFLLGLESSDKFFASQSQIAWMKSVIRKKASNMNRTRRLREQIVVSLETLTTPPGVYDSHESEDIEALLAHCAEILKPQEYSLFLKAVWKREPYSQVSQELGITEWACRKRVQRILKKLSEGWGKGTSE